MEYGETLMVRWFSARWWDVMSVLIPRAKQQQVRPTDGPKSTSEGCYPSSRYAAQALGPSKNRHSLISKLLTFWPLSILRLSFTIGCDLVVSKAFLKSPEPVLIKHELCQAASLADQNRGKDGHCWYMHVLQTPMGRVDVDLGGKFFLIE